MMGMLKPVRALQRAILIQIPSFAGMPSVFFMGERQFRKQYARPFSLLFTRSITS